MASSDNISLTLAEMSGFNEYSSGSGLATPTETTSNASLVTSRPVSPTPVGFPNNNLASNVVTHEISADGDTILNVRLLEAEEEIVDCLKRAPCASLRVLSLVLRLASDPLKECLDSTPGGHGPLSPGEGEPMQAPMLFPTKSPVLWVHRDDNHSLSLVLKRSCTPQQFRESTPVVILMRCLHHGMGHSGFVDGHARAGCESLIPQITEIAWALGCEWPMVPWINLWLRYAQCLETVEPSVDHDQTSWGIGDYYSTQCTGIIVSFVMGDAAAFKFWTLKAILSANRNDIENRAGSDAGGVHVIIHEKLRERRTNIMRQLCNLLNQACVQYLSPGSNSARTLINSVLLGTLMREVHTKFGPHVAFPINELDYDASPSRVFILFQKMKDQINSAWKSFETACSAKEQRKENSTFAREPGNIFWAKVVEVFDEAEGLDLEDFRPGVRKVLDVDTLMGHCAKLNEETPSQNG